MKGLIKGLIILSYSRVEVGEGSRRWSLRVLLLGGASATGLDATREVVEKQTILKQTIR